MRILFIHEVNYLNKVIFEMHEFPELLALRGHDVSFFHYPELDDDPRVALRARHETIAGRVHPDARITLITPPTFGGRAWERYVAPLLDLPSLRAELRSGRYDVVVLYAVPTTGWQAISIAKRSGVPVVFRALDVSHTIRSSLLAPLIRLAERHIYRHATTLSANNPAMRDYCVTMSGRTGQSVVNLPPVDLQHFEQRESRDLRAELGLSPDHRVVLYMGSFFRFSGLDSVVSDMVEQFSRDPELRLVLVGGGEMDASLRALVDELQLQDRVVFTGLVPYDDLPAYLQLADVAINPFQPQLLTNVAFPHKVLQYMAAGVPTVSTRLTGLQGVLGDDSGVTWVDAPGDVAAAASMLALSPASHRAEISTMQLERVASLFSQSAAVDSFEKTLESLGYDRNHE